ncbi:GNAT family N-acetyltransferase [Bacillus salacetis]|uniref:GNAT family N-acetyltransferase n=2 Tax=Bacillus salacetis TaxID=2315464 RepID=A0A3A1QV71_9BACI|nr:GNAT family N-acetyltransferase [Bacillus salacetis]
MPAFVHSVLSRTIKGQVFVDSGSGQSFLIGTDAGIYFVAGNTRNHPFNHFIFEFGRQRKHNDGRFTLFSSSSSWDLVIKEQQSISLKQMRRCSFIFKDKDVIAEKNLPNQYYMKKIDEDLVKNSSEFNEGYYQEYWGSVFNFIENGVGYAILHKEKIVCECTSIFSSDRFAEIDIATHKDYRGKGLASHTAKAFLKDCLMNGIMPRWDCDVANDTSVHLAKKLGFSDRVEHSIFY